MGRPYIYERQIEYWISRQIEEFYLNAGFELMVLPLNQRHEKLIPSDFIFFDQKQTKLFGLQYKTLYEDENDYWPISITQQKSLAPFPWIYYCLSGLKNVQEHRNSLYFAKFMPVNVLRWTEEVFIRGDYRLQNIEHEKDTWGAFYNGLQECTVGTLVESRQHLEKLFIPVDDDKDMFDFLDQVVDLFLPDYSLRKIVHLSPYYVSP